MAPYPNAEKTITFFDISTADGIEMSAKLKVKTHNKFDITPHV